MDAELQDLKLAGIFNEIAGLIIGRPLRYSADNESLLIKKILERTEGYNFPILYGSALGHTYPINTIPLTEKAKLNSKTNKFEIIESGVI